MSEQQGEEFRLLRQVAAGDHAAFELLWQRWGKLAWGIAWRIVPDRRTLGDAVQDVALELFRSAPAFGRNYDGQANPRGWFYTLAARTCGLRRRQAHRRAGFELSSAEPDADPPDSLEGLAPIDRLAVRQVVLDLPGRQRECVLLRYFDGLSEPEVAVRLGISTGAVKSHLARARDTLRQRLDGGGEP